MSVSVTPHLNFRGQARAALDFYKSVFGGEQTVFTYEQAGNVQTPADAGQVMWGQLASDSGVRVMAYDVPSAMPYAAGDNAFFVSLRGADADEIRSYWEGLSEGAQILFDLAPASWSPLYGMIRDRYGVTWVLDVEARYG
jgi:PhnB protein